MIDRCKENILRMAAVQKRTGLSRTTIYRQMARGSFPKSIWISNGLTGWYESDVDRWVANPAGWREAA